MKKNKVTVFEIKFKTVEAPIEIRCKEHSLPSTLFRDRTIVEDGWLFTGQNEKKMRFRPLSEIEFVDMWDFDPDDGKVEPDPITSKIEPNPVRTS